MNMIYQAQARARSKEITWGRFARTAASLLLGMAMSSAVSALWALILGKGYDKASKSSGQRFIQELGSTVPLGGAFATSGALKYYNFDGAPSSGVLDVPMTDLIDAGMRTASELHKALTAPTRKVRKNTVTASERYVRALLAASEMAKAVGVPSQYFFDAKTAYENWSK